MSEAILSNEYCDTLSELFNIGMGRAAKSLSEMVREEVILSVPNMRAMSHQEALDMYIEKDSGQLMPLNKFLMANLAAMPCCSSQMNQVKSLSGVLSATWLWAVTLMKLSKKR